MKLSPREIDKLLISQVGFLAQKRLANGIQLNQTEATGLIAAQLHELVRTGKYSVSQLMSEGKEMLGRRHVLPEVINGLHEIQIEGTFKDGTYLVTVHDPICTDNGNPSKALAGSFFPIPSAELFPLPDVNQCSPEKLPGAVLVEEGQIILNKDRIRTKLKVVNRGDRPVQVGSHYHFIETNSRLDFDRKLAYGKRLDIAAGTAVRFEPGDSKTVTLVEIAGNRCINGGNGLASGPVDHARIDIVIDGLTSKGFYHTSQVPIYEKMTTPFQMSRQAYADMFGPTTGDLVRLGDTDLWIRVEKDFTVYGDECKFGGGKVLRDGMGQASGRRDSECLDLADIGVKNGNIVGIGKAGNPDVMEGVHPSMVVGSNTDVIAGEKQIVTYGAFDSHIHFICPQQAFEALASGVTTMLGGGTGPSTGTNATTCTPSQFYLQAMLQSVDTLPLNFGITGKGNDAGREGLCDQIKAGAVGLKLHEDWGTTPAAIDTCLSVCDEYDVQCLIHTDTLNESSFVEGTVEAFKGRTIHTYHTEGAGGGHAPDIITVVSHSNVLPSSTNPTRPFTRNTLDEHLDMLMVCHHLSKDIPEDIAFAESRIRAETIAAEDVLHDLGAISMMSSDSQAMGRCGEVILRTWKTASKNKNQRGLLPEDRQMSGRDADNFRVKRYIAKYTINPAISHGMSHVIGNIAVGKIADLVFWDFANFGAKPNLVLKSGFIVWSQMGDANASIPTVQPVVSRPMFAASVPQSSVTFISKAAMEAGIPTKYGLRKRIEVVKGTRSVGKKDMKLNDSMPAMHVDPESYEVSADGAACTCEPAHVLPLTQGYFLF